MGRMGISIASQTRLRSSVYAGAGGPVLTPQPVIFSFGESTSGMGGARSLVTDLSYLYTTDPNTKIWDAAQLLSSGVAIKTLKQASMSTVTVTIASPGVFTWNAHGLSDGDPVVLYTTGALPTGYVAGTKYWIVNSATNTFQLAATRGGAAINSSGTQSGTHTAVANGGHEQQPGGAAYVDPVYAAAPGDSGELNRIYRSQVPTARLDHFAFQRGGGRFSDANATFGRAVNYRYDLTDGAYNEMKTQWNAYKAALLAEGKTPQILRVFCTLGGNTAGDATESSNFQTDLANLIAQGRTDIWGNAKVVLNRLSNLQTGTNATNRATIRTATENLVLADPTRMAMLDMDGMPAPIDNVHFSAPAHALRGGYEAQEALGLWYPAKNSQQLGDASYPIREWEFGGQLNTISSGFLANVPDRIVNGQSFSAGAGAQPSLQTRTLANGLQTRFARFDGTSQVLTNISTPLAFNRAGGFILYTVLKGPNTFNGVVYAEGTEAGTTRVAAIKCDSGKACLTIVDDAGTVIASLAPISNTIVFDNTNWHTVILVYDGSTQFTGYVDGVTGLTVPWAKTALTVNNSSIGVQRVNGAAGGFFGIDIGKLGFMQYPAGGTGLSTIVANLHAHLSRFWI